MCKSYNFEKVLLALLISISNQMLLQNSHSIISHRAVMITFHYYHKTMQKYSGRTIASVRLLMWQFLDIVTDLLKPRPTIGRWAHGSACLAQLYLGSVLRNSV
jgi:hypothetical protein